MLGGPAADKHEGYFKGQVPDTASVECAPEHQPGRPRFSQLEVKGRVGCIPLQHGYEKLPKPAAEERTAAQPGQNLQANSVDEFLEVARILGQHYGIYG